MKAVVFHGIGDVRVDEVPEPRLQDEGDAIVRLTVSAICGTDLHIIRGSLPGVREGTVLGHEGVGVVEEIGRGVRNLREGQRVVVPSTIACGHCSYCRAGYFAQCDHANPNGPLAGTAFFGGPEESGGFDGLQAERARIPLANVGLVPLPDEVSDEQAILLSDIFPTGWFGAKLAEVKSGDTVAVFGCGPVGQFAIASAWRLGAGRVLAVDVVPSRLEMARAQGAEVIDFEAEDPVECIREMTGGIGVDRAIDAVGVDALRPHAGPAAKYARDRRAELDAELQRVAPDANGRGDAAFAPGDGPSMVLRWAVSALAKAGSLGIVGVYPTAAHSFPIGEAMNKNLTIRLGNCNHRRYVPELVEMVRAGHLDPTRVLTHRTGLVSAVDAYKSFDRREEGWMKVALEVGA
jgi:threonine dehydrogenase-like Zn-dependent dehydrogenase